MANIESNSFTRCVFLQCQHDTDSNTITFSLNKQYDKLKVLILTKTTPNQ